MLKPRERIVITESHPKVWEPIFQRAIYHDGRKLISYSDGRRELFNLKSDGAEAHNLLDEQPDVAEKLQALLDAWDQATVPSGDAQPVELSDEDIELLRDIGYIQ
jgi:arylsulfatase A-like enzyme